MQKAKGSWAKIGIIAAVICFCLGAWYVLWPEITDLSG
jgi:hypothetical protein